MTKKPLRRLGKPKETKILLVLGLQNSLCKDPRFSRTKARIVKQIRRYILDSISHHKKKRHIRFLTNPTLTDSDMPDDLLDVLGSDPIHRKDAYDKFISYTIPCRTPDPFLDTKLLEHLTFLTRRKPFTIEICGFGYDRIWLTAMTCAIRGFPVTILSDLVGSWWAYEFQEEDRTFNNLIGIKEIGEPTKTLVRGKEDEDICSSDKGRGRNKQ